MIVVGQFNAFWTYRTLPTFFILISVRRLTISINTGEISLKQATSRLRLVLESVAENHSEYRDWNSTTTQSDRGDYLYVLLEFLRIKAEYERIVWTLRPVSMAHRVLVRSGATEAASKF